MIVSFDHLLILGIIVLYIFDSFLLIYSNEIILLTKKEKWYFNFPNKNAQMMRKFLYVLSPLNPTEGVFRVFWPVTAIEVENEDINNVVILNLELTALRYATFFLFFLFFVILPIIILNYGSGIQLLCLILFIYFTISIMLFQIWRKKDKLYLSNATFLKISFDSLMCAPFAINLYRKITLNYSVISDPIYFAYNLFDADSYENFTKELSKRIDERLITEDVESTRYRVLEEYRSKIMSMNYDR
jgi:hypothetical protein